MFGQFICNNNSKNKNLFKNKFNQAVQFSFSETNQKKSSSQPASKKQTKRSCYDILGIQYTATDQQIKKAYLDGVKKYHPDLTKQQNAASKFQQIQQAYDQIDTPQKRSKYDQLARSRGYFSTAQQKIFTQQDLEKIKNLKQRMKKFSRKEQVSDQYQFSYKLFKDNYQKIKQKDKDFDKYHGDWGHQYWVHKDQKPQSYKKLAIATVAGIGCIIGAMYYVNS